MAKTGRPSEYTQERADYICDELASGRTLTDIVENDEGQPSYSTVFKWLGDFPQFSDRYTRARQVQAEKLVDEILSIADDKRGDTYLDEDGNPRADHEWLNRSRLRVDTRKWFVSKVLPKVYGDKITQEISGPDGGAVQHHIALVPKPESREEWLAAVQAKEDDAD